MKPRKPNARRAPATQPSESGDLSHRPFAELARQRLAEATRRAPAPAPRGRPSEAAAPRAHEADPPRGGGSSSTPQADRARPDESFAALLEGVAPLRPSPARRVAVREAPDGLVDARAPVRFETSDDGAHLEGRRLDVDVRELRRLRRGLFVVDATLDLHGRGAREARAEVTAFVRRHALAGDRLLLVIHGRGNHTPGGQGILRGEIGAWLSQGAAARHVAAFVTAPQEQGGEGAVIVLLARQGPS